MKGNLLPIIKGALVLIGRIRSLVCPAFLARFRFDLIRRGHRKVFWETGLGLVQVALAALFLAVI